MSTTIQPTSAENHDVFHNTGGSSINFELSPLKGIEMTALNEAACVSCPVITCACYSAGKHLPDCPPST